MKKILLVTLLLIGLTSCGYERVDGRNPNDRIIYKIVSGYDGYGCYSKYYIEDNSFNTFFGKEHTYIVDTCNKWNISDTIKLK